MKKGTLKGRDKGRSRRYLAAFEKILARKERPIDRVDLARAIDVDPSLISLILSSDRHPTPAFVGRLCRHPNIDADEALALITAHLQDVSDEALPPDGKLTVDRFQLSLKDRRSLAATR